jgi:hypothetical protein
VLEVAWGATRDVAGLSGCVRQRKDRPASIADAASTSTPSHLVPPCTRPEAHDAFDDTTALHRAAQPAEVAEVAEVVAFRLTQRQLRHRRSHPADGVHTAI